MSSAQGLAQKAYQPVHKAPVAMIALWLLTTMAWWALAFYPVSAASPQWLTITQYACFGKRPGGMLPLEGWILLFFGPALLLTGVWLTFRLELSESWQHYWRSAGFKIFAAFIVLAFVGETVWVGKRIRDDYKLSQIDYSAPLAEQPFPDSYPQLKMALPEFNLTDQSGKVISAASLKGFAVILTFAYAHCTTVCPTLVSDTTAALSQLPEGKVRAVFVTLDPWRDSPADLPDMARRWNLPGNAHLLSGDVDQVTKTLEALKVPLQRDEKTGDVVHPALIYVVNAQGDVIYGLNNPPVAWLVSAVSRVLN